MAYRQHSSSFSANREPQLSPVRLVPVTDRNRYHQYSSDPTLIDGSSTDDELGGTNTHSNGRRSAEGQFTQSHHEEHPARHERIAKKKKMKRLKSFVHVFLGGLKRTQSVYTPSSSKESNHHERSASDVILTTRSQQKDERDGMINSMSSPNHSTNLANDQRRLAFPPDHPPGLCGLFNHGNTCFMNAVLQCLSNTDQLAEYFVTDQYKNDINRQKLAIKKFGTNGVVTEQFALLLKCLWNGHYDPRVTSQFKDVVGHYANQYQGTSQHDAQEFFLWLLDNVHEDLNQAGKKKYKQIKDSTGRPDEVVAAETLKSHSVRNNSFIQNLFQGQFRSVIICPSCGSQSATFDPYVCVSLPLPQQHNRPVYVTVVYRSSSRKTRVYGVNIPIDATIRDLRNSLAELCGISRYHLVLADLNSSGFHRTFYDDQHITVVNSSDLMFGFECPPYRGDNPDAITHSNPSGSKELMLVLLVNKFGQTQYGKRFGPPLILRVWRDLTHSQFQSVVLKAMMPYLREGVKLADICRGGTLFQCRVVDGLPGQCVLPTDADHPFYSPSIHKAIQVSLVYGGPAHIKMIAEWDPETKASVFGVVPDQVPEPHESVTELRQHYQAPLETSLRDCLKIYTREETLNREDSWYCPHCKHNQHDATKRITLWTVPDVLVLHLKRFRHVGYSRTKLNTLVKFPVTSLDMTPYLAPRSPIRPGSATLERRNKILHISRSPKTLPTKSVTFSDQSPAKMSEYNKKRSGKSHTSSSSKWWKRSKKESKQPEAIHTSAPPICDSPASVRSAPPDTNGYHSRSLSSPHRSMSTPDHTLTSPAHSSLSRTSSFNDSHLDNTYDLYAVCNHQGSMNHGHYTSYCRNPADGRWYGFDDINVQPVTEEQLVTPGAYMLFYVRQSLLVQSPLSSSESSASSGSSSHWTFHMPQFRLNLGRAGSDETPNQIAAQQRPRLGSTNSAVSAPPVSGIRGVSPPSSGHTNDDVFSSPPRQGLDGQSAVSLPHYQPHMQAHSQPSYPGSPAGYQRSVSNGYYPQGRAASQHQAISRVLSSPTHARITASGRHASLRLGKAHHHSSSEASSDAPLRRGASFHAPRHHSVQQPDTRGQGRYVELPPNPHYPHTNRPVPPSRSIPNMPNEMDSDLPGSGYRRNYQYNQPLSQGPILPSRSIPNMPQEMSPHTPARYPKDDIYDHFVSRQLPLRHGSKRERAVPRQAGEESCV